mgnify:FL=1
MRSRAAEHRLPAGSDWLFETIFFLFKAMNELRKVPVTASYALLTAVKNEAEYLPLTLESVAKQTLAPTYWIVVDDGSTDATPQILAAYAEKHRYIRLLHRSETRRSFSSKARALNQALEYLVDLLKSRGQHLDFVGVCDGDVSFGPDYYAELIKRMEGDSRLGIVGGWVHELQCGRFDARADNREHSVAGCTQFFQLFRLMDLGSFMDSPYGGEDWIAELRIRARGLEVRSFRDLAILHHKPSVASDWMSASRQAFRVGRMDAFVGCFWWFHLLRSVRRWRARPAVLGVLLRGAGYLYQRLTGGTQLTGEVLESFHREQRRRVSRLLTS